MFALVRSFRIKVADRKKRDGKNVFRATVLPVNVIFSTNLAEVDRRGSILHQKVELKFIVNLQPYANVCECLTLLSENKFFLTP